MNATNRKKDYQKSYIVNLATGVWKAKIIGVAIELEIFTEIDNGVNTTKKLVNKLGTNIIFTEMLLNACVALDLLKNKNGILQNETITKKYLVKGSPYYYGDMFSLITNYTNSNWDSLKKTLRLKRNVRKYYDHFCLYDFTKAMHNDAIESAQIFAQKIDFSSVKKMMDIGGGSGVYSIMASLAYPKIKAHVFDYTDACKVAKQYIKKYKCNSTVSVIEGDFINVKWPKDIDLLLLSRILSSFSENKRGKLLKKCYKVLPKGGKLIINEHLLESNKTAPVYSVLMSINLMLAHNGGSCYSKKEIKELLTSYGFKKIKIIELQGTLSAIVAEK